MSKSANRDIIRHAAVFEKVHTRSLDSAVLPIAADSELLLSTSVCVFGIDQLPDGRCREDSGNATETLADYYRRTCIYQPTQDGRGSSVGTNQDEVVSRPAETMGGQAKATGGPAEMAGGGDSQDNLGRTVGLVSGFLTFATAGVAVYICLSRHRVKVRDQEPL